MPTHFICFYRSHCQLLLLYCKILREFCNRFTCLHQLIETFTNTHIDTFTEYMIIPASNTYSIFTAYKEPCATCMLSLQSCPTLCNPMDCSPPGFSVHGIFQARILEWFAMPSSSGELPDPGIEPVSPVSLILAGGSFTTREATQETPRAT